MWNIQPPLRDDDENISTMINMVPWIKGNTMPSIINIEWKCTSNAGNKWWTLFVDNLLKDLQGWDIEIKQFYFLDRSVNKIVGPKMIWLKEWNSFLYILNSSMIY